MTRFVLVVTLVVAISALAAQQLSVQVRNAKLRTRASYLAATTADVGYGTRLTVIEESGPWRKLRTDDGRTGWLHESALTTKKIKLSAGDRDVEIGADQDELALAGKGFNEEVEEAFKESGAEADYTWVDRMAGWTVTPEEAMAFLDEGRVTGGAR